jgi:hypothetical protein
MAQTPLTWDMLPWETCEGHDGVFVWERGRDCPICSEVGDLKNEIIDLQGKITDLDNKLEEAQWIISDIEERVPEEVTLSRLKET